MRISLKRIVIVSVAVIAPPLFLFIEEVPVGRSIEILSIVEWVYLFGFIIACKLGDLKNG